MNQAHAVWEAKKLAALYPNVIAFPFHKVKEAKAK